MPMTKVAAVDENLKVVKVFDWDRTFDLVHHTHQDWPKVARRVGLTKAPDRWVDITDRPDIKEGDTFPFGPKQDEEAKNGGAVVAGPGLDAGHR